MESGVVGEGYHDHKGVVRIPARCQCVSAILWPSLLADLPRVSLAVQGAG